MKINSIEIGCRRYSEVRGFKSKDFQLYIFKTPVVFRTDDKSITMKNSSAIIFSSEKSQSFSSADGRPMKFDRISFRPSATDSQYAVSMNIKFDIPLEIRDDYVISTTIKNMKVQSANVGRHIGEFMEISMRSILICISDMTEKQIHPDVPKYNYLKYIHDTVYADPLRIWNIEDVCRVMGISKSYFHRIYYSVFGVTFRQDIIESRLAYASSLLKNTDMSVSAVAEKCGYDSDSYFMRQFKKRKGVTPSEYRRITEEESVDYAKIFGKN